MAVHSSHTLQANLLVMSCASMSGAFSYTCICIVTAKVQMWMQMLGEWACPYSLHSFLQASIFEVFSSFNDKFVPPFMI